MSMTLTKFILQYTNGNNMTVPSEFKEIAQ